MYASLNGFLRRINTGLGALAGATTVALMFSVVPDLISRSFFGVAIYGMSETGIMLLVLIVFLALPVAQVRKEHFHVAVLDSVMPPNVIKGLWIFRDLVSAAISGTFAWYAIHGAISSTMRFEQSYAVVEFPVWPAKILVAVGLTLLALQFLMDAIGRFGDPVSAYEKPALPTH